MKFYIDKNNRNSNLQVQNIVKYGGKATFSLSPHSFVLPADCYLVSECFDLSVKGFEDLPKLRGFHKKRIFKQLFGNSPKFNIKDYELYSPYFVKYVGSNKFKGGFQINQFRNDLIERRKCVPYLEVDTASLGRRFLKEVWYWGLTGFKYRPEWLVNDLLNKCKGCPFYAQLKDKGKCQLCGCDLREYASPHKNKLLWASTHCPLDPPCWF